MILLTFVGPEYRGRSMRAASDEDLAEATGGAAAVEEQGRVRRSNSSEADAEVGDPEKGTRKAVEV